MTKHRLRRMVEDAGFTVVELGMAMLITALVSALMLTWILSVGGVDARAQSNDLALGDLRDATDQLGRDVRSAEYLTATGDASLTMWLDSDRDDVLDPGELVSWSIGTDGSVVRSTNAGVSVVLASRIDRASSGFAYDALVPGDVARVSVELVAVSPSGDSVDLLRIATDVYLRNS